jgi:hypothetical protein
LRWCPLALPAMTRIMPYMILGKGEKVNKRVKLPKSKLLPLSKKSCPQNIGYAILFAVIVS